MLKLINLTVVFFFFANIHSFWIWCLQHVPKKLWQEHVYHCMDFVPEGTNCWSFVGGILSHSCLMYDLGCSTVRGFRCCILCFINHTFSMGDGSGCRQASLVPVLFYYESTVFWHVQNVAWHCLAEISRDIPEKDRWQHMLLQNLCVPFSINGAFTDMQVTHAMGTNTPPYHHKCRLLNFALITIWMVLLPFGPEDTTSMISKNYLKCGLIRPQHTFPLCNFPIVCWETLFLNCWTVCSHSCSQSGKPCTILACVLGDAPLIHSLGTDLFPVNLFISAVF